MPFFFRLPIFPWSIRVCASTEDFEACAKFAERLGNGSKLTYVQGGELASFGVPFPPHANFPLIQTSRPDVTKKDLISQKIKDIAAQEGRLDVCIAAAGILGAAVRSFTHFHCPSTRSCLISISRETGRPQVRGVPRGRVAKGPWSVCIPVP